MFCSVRIRSKTSVMLYICTLMTQIITFIPANCHTFGVFFLLIFGLTNGFVTHALIVTHSADLPLTFEEQPLILMIFATHFHSHRLWGCEIEAHPEYLGFPDHTFWKILVGKSEHYSNGSMTSGTHKAILWLYIIINYVIIIKLLLNKALLWERSEDEGEWMTTHLFAFSFCTPVSGLDHTFLA